MKFKSLKTKVIFSVLLIFFLIFPAFSYFGIYYFKYNAIKSVQAQQLLLVSKLADEINTKLVILTNVLTASADTIDKEIFNSPIKAREYIKNHISLNSVFDDNILIFNKKGQLLSESGDNSPERIMMSFAWRDYIAVPSETHRLYISAPLRAAASTKLKDPMIVISAPVIRDEKLIGFVSGAVNLYNENLFNNDKFTFLDGNGYVFIVDSQSNIVMHPDENKIVSKVDLSSKKIIKKILTEDSGSIEYRNKDNEIIQSSFCKVPISSWTVVANYKSKIIFKHIFNAEKNIILFLISGAIIVFIFLNFIVKRLVRPILSLKSQVDGLLDGNEYLPKIHVDSNDEIMETANAFNNLLEEINQKENELKRRNEIFQTVCDFSKDWIYWIDNNGSLIYISPAAMKISGYSKEELSDYPNFYEKLIHPDDREKWLRSERTVRMKEEYCELEIRIIAKDGSIKWLHNICKGYFSEGIFYGVRGVFSDITSTKKAEIELTSRENIYSILFQNAGSLTILTNENFEITEFNKKVFSLYNCQYGESIFTYLNSDIASVSSQLAQKGSQEAVEIDTHFRINGQINYYRWQINQLSYSLHGLSGFMFLGIDITDKKNRNEELSKMAIKTETEKYVSQMEAIIKSVSEGIISIDSKGSLSSYNSAAEKIFKLAPDHIGKSIQSINDFFASKLTLLVKNAGKNKREIDAARVEYFLDNKPVSLKINITPLLSSENIEFGTLVVVTVEEDLSKNFEYSKFANLIGSNKKMQALYSSMTSLADVDSTVLILGESGTGKELVASGIHESGARKNKPFIKLNCSAIPENLLESELFGHEKGAFTGAYKDKIGKFEAANNGTIFLDEIGDISASVQVKLLRVLQEKEIEVIGKNKPVKVDVRIIAATNKDLKDLVDKGQFREDLYYRLKVVTLSVPPLRERKDDILPLAYAFIDKFNKKMHKDILDVSDEVKSILLEYDWPGNVRELEHIIESSCLMEGTSFITSSTIPKELSKNIPHDPQDEKSMILNALEEAKGYKTKAAKLLKISRATLYRKMNEHGIDY